MHPSTAGPHKNLSVLIDHSGVTNTSPGQAAKPPEIDVAVSEGRPFTAAGAHAVYCAIQVGRHEL